MSRGPRLLTPAEARRSLASRLIRVRDRARQIDVRLGNRPYQVFLVWSKWDGDERGMGNETIVCRCPILPTPIVEDMTNVSLSPMGAGIVPLGSVRVSDVSARYRIESLTGKVVPEREDQVPEPYDFFYEVVEDGRHECPPLRPRFRLMSVPHLDAAKQQWMFVLERQGRDMGKDGKPINEPIVPPESPWDTMKLPPPDEDD